jgi:MFS superfamily sulfate permease-like transporter
MKLKGAASFVRLPQLAQALEQVPPGAELHVHLDELTFIDHACFELLQNWEKQHASTGGKVVLEWAALASMVQRNRPSSQAREVEASQAQARAHTAPLDPAALEGLTHGHPQPTGARPTSP